MLEHLGHIDHTADLVIGKNTDLLDFVGGPEPVKKMEERNAGLQRRSLCDQREVESFLNGIGRKQRVTGLANGHHVRMIPKDRKSLGGQRTCGNMDHHRCKFAGDLVHIRDHQEKPLRRRKGRRQGPALKRSVNRSRRAAFALHLHDRRDRPPDILLPLGGPLIGPLAHRRGRRDRVDRDALVHAERDIRDGFPRVHGDEFLSG